MSEISTNEQIAKSSAMMTIVVLVSRITGFIRTWAQAFALGATMYASCYTVANNLPNLLFEVTIGGMLYTAFLPVYMNVKKKCGTRGGSRYASNMFSIILILMGIITIAGFIFAGPLIFTQSAGAESGSFSFEQATLFFRFFCIEVLLYPLSALLGSILNAERKYFWAQAGPVFNNLIVIISFIVGYYVSLSNDMAGFLIFALGNPLGVLAQLVFQIPPLAKTGVKLKLHINLSDPALKETIKIGIPALLITLFAAILASVQSSCSLYTTSSGAAILYYVRVWFVLPHSLFAVPICTAMFTELSDLFAQKRMQEFKIRAINGLKQIHFMIIPFACFLICFSPYLIFIFASGNFEENETAVAILCLILMSIGLPFYSVTFYLQDIFSSMHSMRGFSVIYAIAVTISCIICIALTPLLGLTMVVGATTIFNFLVNVVGLIRLSSKLGELGIGVVLKNCLKLVLLGLMGGFVGSYVTFLTGSKIFDLMNMSTSILTIGFGLVIGGCVALAITFGGAILFKIPEAVMVKEFVRKSRTKNPGKHAR